MIFPCLRLDPTSKRRPAAATPAHARMPTVSPGQASSGLSVAHSCCLQPGACALCSLPASSLQVSNVAGKKGLIVVLGGTGCQGVRASALLSSGACLSALMGIWCCVCFPGCYFGCSFFIDCCIVVPILSSQVSEIT